MGLGLGFHASETLCAHVAVRENMDKTIISAASTRLAKTVFTVLGKPSFDYVPILLLRFQSAAPVISLTRHT